MRALCHSVLVVVILSTVGCAASVNRIGYTAEKQDEAVSTEKKTYSEGETQSPVLITTDTTVVTNTATELLGQMRYRDSGLSTECSQDDAFRLFERDAHSLGANIVLITWEQHPDFWSTCYRADASLYSTPDTSYLAKVDDYRDSNHFAAKKKGKGVSTAAQIVGFTAGFAGGYLLMSLLLGGN